MTNGLSLSFKGEVFAHELDHIHQELSTDHALQHLEFHHHQDSNGDTDIDVATHLSLHSIGQYQPFFFYSFPQIPDQIATETSIIFISAFIPETIPDLPLRPPRSTS